MSPRLLLALGVGAIALAPPSDVAAQVAEWIPANDPGMAAMEQLILRGDVRDPSPMVRPLNRVDAVAVLRQTQCEPSTWCARSVATLLDRWEAAGQRKGGDGGGGGRGGRRSGVARSQARIAVRAGIQHSTSARDALLWPSGDGTSATGFAQLDAAARYRSAVGQFVARYDPNARRDPDRGSASRHAVRLDQFAIGVATPWGGISLGEVRRHWGPPDLAGLARSGTGPPPPSVTVELGGPALRATFVAARLDDAIAADGSVVRRWLAMHRLDWRPSPRLGLALWETAVAQGEHRSADDALDGLFTVLSFDQLFGRAQQRNSIVGVDATWRWRQLRLEGQLAIDDRTSRAPARYAFTTAVGGPLGSRATWRANWTRISSLAYRTSDAREDFLYHDVPLGPAFPDHDLIALTLGVPVTDLLVVQPEVTMLAQGEGRIQNPFPSFDSLPKSVGFLDGIVRHTIRVAIHVAGRIGPWGISGEGGVNFDRNADHVVGFNRNHFEGRIVVTLGGFHRWSGP